MSFWTTSTGKQITGSEEDSFVMDFTSIPNNTKARAKVKKLEEGKNYKEEPNYQLTWEITDGDFKGRIIKQNFDVFSSDDKKSDKAKNMLARLSAILNQPFPLDRAPVNSDFLSVINKIAGIKVREMPTTNKKGEEITTNFVSELHLAGNDWISETGVKIELSDKSSARVESAFSRNQQPFSDNWEI